MTDENKDPGDLEPVDQGGELASVPKTSLGLILRSAVICDLQPLPLPEVDSDFSSLPTMERTIETLRYNFALLEYRLGSNGWLRAWIFSTLRVLLFVLVPLAGLSILISVLVPATAGIAQIFTSLESICQSAFWACVYLLFTLVVVAAAIAFVSVLSLARQRAKLAEQVNSKQQWTRNRTGRRN